MNVTRLLGPTPTDFPALCKEKRDLKRRPSQSSLVQAWRAQRLCAIERAIDDDQKRFFAAALTPDVSQALDPFTPSAIDRILPLTIVFHQEAISWGDLLVRSGLVQSKRQARELIGQGAIRESGCGLGPWRDWMRLLDADAPIDKHLDRRHPDANAISYWFVVGMRKGAVLRAI